MKPHSPQLNSKEDSLYPADLKRRQMLRLPAVKSRTGLSRSSIYLRISENRFPRPVPLGGRAVGWIEEEVDNWLTAQIEASRDSQARTQGQSK